MLTSKPENSTLNMHVEENRTLEICSYSWGIHNNKYYFLRGKSQFRKAKSKYFLALLLKDPSAAGKHGKTNLAEISMYMTKKEIITYNLMIICANYIGYSESK